MLIKYKHQALVQCPDVPSRIFKKSITLILNQTLCITTFYLPTHLLALYLSVRTRSQIAVVFFLWEWKFVGLSDLLFLA